MLVADKFFTNFRAEVRIAGDMSVNGENVGNVFLESVFDVLVTNFPPRLHRNCLFGCLN